MSNVIPLLCSRLIALSNRNPRRAVALAHRAYARTLGSDLLLQAWATYTLGKVLIAWERYDEARNHVQQAAATFATSGLVVPQLYCRAALLLLAQINGGVDLQTEWEALANDFESHSLAHEAIRARFEQTAQLNMLGRIDEAMRLIERIAPFVDQHGTPRDQARLLRLTAVAYANSGALSQARNAITQAITKYTHIRLPIDVAHCAFYRAWIFQRLEQFGAACDDLNRAGTTFRHHGLPRSEAMCMCNLGLALSRIGRFDLALAVVLQARGQFEQLGNESMMAICDTNLGIVAHYSGLFDLAMGNYRRAEATAQRLGMRRHQLVCQRNQALVLHAQGDPQAALDALVALEQTVAPTGELLEYAEIVAAQGRAWQAIGDNSRALTALVRAQEIFAHAGSVAAAAECLLDRGWLHLTGGALERAIDCFRTAAPMLVERPMHRWRLDYGLGLCAYRHGDYASALRHYQVASATVATMRRTLACEQASSRLFVQARQLYVDAILLAAEQNDPLTVLDLVQQQQALALEHQLIHASIAVPPDLQKLHEQQRVVLRTLIAERTTSPALDAALTSYTDLLLRIRHADPTTIVETDSAASLNLASLRHQFSSAYRSGWTALIYASAGDEILVVMLDADNIQLTRIPCDPTLEQQLSEACLPQKRRYTYLDYPFLSGRASVAWATLGALGERLLPLPACAVLHPDRRLLIVPSGPLHAIPWAALRVEDRWLCECAIIQLLPSLSFWSRLAAKPRPGNQALLIGCRKFNGRAPDLTNAITTLDLVEAVWPGNCTRLQDDHATRRAILDLAERGELARFGLLHIASHGQLVATRGLLAHLKLADDDLLFDEVAQLSLRGALVVLTACEGARGEVLPGDEVMSLSWALLAAGARDVIASQWQLYDETVLALLTPLYAALARGQDAPTALAYAQRQLLARVVQGEEPSIINTPFVWASLCALGAGTSS